MKLQAKHDRLYPDDASKKMFGFNMPYTPKDSWITSDMLLLTLNPKAQANQDSKGIAVAKAKGRKIGKGRMVRPDEETGIRKRVNGGEAIAWVARKMGISRPTIYRCLRNAQAF